MKLLNLIFWVNLLGQMLVYGRSCILMNYLTNPCLCWRLNSDDPPFLNLGAEDCLSIRKLPEAVANLAGIIHLHAFHSDVTHKNVLK